VKRQAGVRIVGLLLLIAGPGLPAAADETPWWPAEVERALTRAGKNRPELVQALQAAPRDQRPGMAFLVANMPDSDLQTLRAAFLLDNVALAWKARAQVPWGRRLPEEVFLNHVIPYANLDEARHPWRQQLYRLCLPLVKDCKTPAEAAQRLNATIFPKLRVRYSTGRNKPHQSPKETIELGLASCTGLSILLIDACRSVAVPARLVGTPLWANKRGNHTWVEVWDRDWHFAGAAEPDPKGLDHAWFEHDASQAIADSRVHAIYAASFRRTGVTFPLVWAPHRKDCYAENVTARYARAQPLRPDHTRVLVRVWQPGRKQRLAVPVAVVDRLNANQVLSGESRGEQADTNDVLAFELRKGRDYLLRLGKPVLLEKPFKTAAEPQQFLDVEVPAEKTREPALSKEQAERLGKAAQAFFSARAADQADWQFAPEFDQLLARHEEAVRRVVWQAYRAAPIHAALKQDFEKNRVRSPQRLSSYVVKKVGKRPQNGWPLFIAMHGGGNAPKAVNDSQWKIMQIYYRDQPSVTGYQYLALRAPNDTWNGFYDDAVLPLISNLIRQFLLFGDVDPDKVFLMGYSHGGYGAFFIGPKIPDLFAAVHCSAAAPTDGTISPRTLRNTRFTFMIGEKDNAYGRRPRCETFNKAVQKLKEENKDAFPVDMEFKTGFGHGGLPDRDKIKEMYPFTRNPVPGRLTWDLTDRVVSHFFWLSVPTPAAGQGIDALIQDNTVQVTTHKLKEFDLHLDGRLVNLARPVRITCDGKTQTVQLRPRLLTLCQGLLERGDPELAFSCRIRVATEKK
jgi:transglutaminase-like putative cysteine protease/predicted esterase